MAKRICLTLILFSLLSSLFGNERLRIGAGDLYATREEDEAGFHLWVRQTGSVNSILLTESSADPEKRTHSYTLRAEEYNPINGDEQRVLDGKVLTPQTPLYFLMDSTPEPTPIFDGDMAFHIYVPFRVVYGYPGGRTGFIDMEASQWLNIRAFERSLADYAGEYFDNPFQFNLMQIIPTLPPPIEEVEEPELINSEPLKELAESANGSYHYVEDGEEATDVVGRIIDTLPGPIVDIALVIDTTISMKPHLEDLKAQLATLIESKRSPGRWLRVGVVLYREYKEEYLTRPYPFLNDSTSLQNILNTMEAKGGRDIEEAVYEGIYEALSGAGYSWEGDSKAIIQIGDADPHPEPRGKITKEMVFTESQRQEIPIHVIEIES